MGAMARFGIRIVLGMIPARRETGNINPKTEGNEYDDAESFSDGLAPVKLNGKWGFVDKKGSEYWNMTEDQAREQMNKR